MMLPQIIINTLISSSVIFLAGLSFSIIYSTVRFFHFGHGIIFTCGAYFVFYLCNILGLPTILSIVLAIILVAILGGLMEICIYKKLRQKGSSELIYLLASIGLYVVIQNVISMSFGDETQVIRSGAVEKGISVFGASITSIQIITVFSALCSLFLFHKLLRGTKAGKAIRAVSSNRQLASLSGINTNRVILYTFLIGSALAGITGILVALDVDMTPTMGMNILLMGVVAVVIGGVGNINGVALGALLIGSAQSIIIWNISSQWQDGGVFLILMLILLFKPQGLFGHRAPVKIS